MYLDPGTSSLFIQAIFALMATIFATFGRCRAWLSKVWTRASEGLSSYWRRNKGS
jgi:hypothetical protein